MIGILILIPIIVLVVVALVSVIVSVNAHIAVEDLQLRYKDSDKTIYTLQIPFDEVANINIYNYVDAKVYPEKATNKTVEWQIVGDVSYTDENYEASRNAYLANLSSLKAELGKRTCKRFVFDAGKTKRIQRRKKQVLQGFLPYNLRNGGYFA